MNNHTRCLYAQLAEVDGQQIVVCVSDLCGEVNQPNMVPLQSLQNCQLGDIYQNGTFTTPPAPVGA